MKQQNIINQIHSFILEHKLITPDMRIIVGLSGGPDSVFLLHALAALKQKISFDVITAHLDHEWREHSAADAQFCMQLAASLHINCIVKKRSELNFDFKYNGSREEEGRAMRRYFFEHLLKEQNAHRIALGHHAQDQQETFFIRLIRGSSLTGLSAMRPHSGHYIRPLLGINKDEIVAYLTKEQISFVIDQTNDSDAFLRNRIRHQVLPALKACDNRFEQNFLKTLTRLQETDDCIEQIVHNLFKQISSINNGKWVVNHAQLLAQPVDLQYRLIMHWLIQEGVKFPVSQQFLQEIIRFLKNGTGSHQLNAQWRLSKKSNYSLLE